MNDIVRRQETYGHQMTFRGTVSVVTEKREDDGRLSTVKQRKRRRSDEETTKAVERLFH